MFHMQKVRSVLGFAFAAVLSGCATQTPEPSPRANANYTLANSPDLPGAEISKLVQSRRQWQTLRDLPYNGYVVVGGVIGNDGQLAGEKVIRVFPDDSRNSLALALARNVSISAGTTGSTIPPKAEVYVIFYEKMLEGSLAVVFGRQTTSFLPRNYNDGVYLNIRTF